MTDQTHSQPSLIPAPTGIGAGDLRAALSAGLKDFRRAPVFGLFFSAFYVLGGMILWQVFVLSGQSWWFIPLAVGFPLLAPFAATGLYEVSRRIEKDEPLAWGAVLGCVFAQKDRQVPSMAMVILLAFMFWVFVAHTMFALFFGLRPITNSTFDMLLSANGITMLIVGGAVGGTMAAVFFALTVVSLPLLLDKEVDFISAMIASVGTVTRNPGTMALWALAITFLLLLGMLPYFLGLLVVLPVLGHASWHLYRRLMPEDGMA